MFVLENIAFHHLIHDPLNLSHMQITTLLDKFFVIRQWIKAENVERQTVGYYHLTHHHTTLLLCIVLLVERIVGAQIFVETDAQRMVAHNDTLVKRTNLCINMGELYTWQFFLQPSESLRQFVIDVVYFLILFLNINKHCLQRGILEEMQEFGIDVRIVHLTNE